MSPQLHLIMEFQAVHIRALHYHNLVMVGLGIAYQLALARRRRARQRRVNKCRWWVRPWIGRRMQFGIYDQLLLELRTEDQRGFKNFMRMPPEMFDELLGRVGPGITKQHTLGPFGLWSEAGTHFGHLASGSTYSTMHSYHNICTSITNKRFMINY